MKKSAVLICCAAVPLAMSLTGCNSTEAGGAAAPATKDRSVSASPRAGEETAPADPKEEAQALLKEPDATPLGLDVGKVYATRTQDNVLETFPAEDFGTEEGIGFALLSYQQLNNLSLWNSDRDTTRDYQDGVLPFAELFTPDALKSIQADVKKNNALNLIPTAPGGIMVDGQFHELDNTQPHVHRYSEPDIYTSKEGGKDLLVVAGQREFHYNLENGDEATGINSYWLNLVPDEGAGEQTWRIDGLGWQMVEEIKVDSQG